MHPALSVIFFTTLSGAGYGLLAWLGAALALAGLRDHLARKIDTNADGWLKRGQQITAPAANFEHALPRRDNPPVDLLQPMMILGAEKGLRRSSA